MKKVLSLLTLTMLLLSACSANVGLDVGGELLPGGDGGGQGGSIFSNPVVIALLVILGVVLVILLVSVAGKKR